MSAHNLPVTESSSVESHVIQDATFTDSMVSQTPWWAVSTLFHVLLISLVGLATLSVEISDHDLIIVQPQIFVPKQAQEKEPESPTANAAILAQYDPSLVTNNVYTMPNFGVESNIFETLDKDIVAEEVGARGTPDSMTMFPTKNPLDKPGSNGQIFQTGMMLEEAIGVGDSRTIFSGNGTGEGTQSGDSHGRFGKPNAAGKRNTFVKYNPAEVGRMKQWEDSVTLALRWLAYHQEADGHWDVKKYGAANRNDTAVTSLALLAFLGYGCSEKVGEHKQNIKQAVAWLIAHQAPNGLIRNADDDSAAHRSGGYPMAIATLALCEAAGMANIPETRAAAQLAIDYCVKVHQSGEGYDKRGWRYAAKSEGDMSVTGWFIMALKTAKVAGLKVPHESFDGAIKFIESVEVKEKATADSYVPASHFKYMPNADHAASAHRLTAIATLARQFLGWQKDDLQASVVWFIEKGGIPSYGANGEKVDLYYWYYGSMAAFQQDREIFKSWSHALLDALLPSQEKKADDAGSWNPTGDYSAEWGRVGQTALSALCLEVYYRNPRVYEKK